MKKSIISLIAVLLSAGLLVAGETVLDFLKAESDGNVITIEWKSSDETNVDYYSIERSGKDRMFREIATEDAKGYSTTYKYIDESALRDINSDEKTQSVNVYYYRIVVHTNDNKEIVSDEQRVTHKTSGIRKTWGMLKEMFR